MDDKNFEQMDREAVAYLRSHLDPSFVKEYNDDEIYLYLLDQYDQYFMERGLLEEDSDELTEDYTLDLEDMAAYVVRGYAEEMGVKMEEEDAYEALLVLMDFLAQQGYVEIEAVEEEE